ncbi:hypothetical protein, partial [Microvirga tunisiensis]
MASYWVREIIVAPHLIILFPEHPTFGCLLTTLSVPVPKTLSNSDLASPYFPVVHEAVSGVAEYIGLYLSGNR